MVKNRVVRERQVAIDDTRFMKTRVATGQLGSLWHRLGCIAGPRRSKRNRIWNSRTVSINRRSLSPLRSPSPTLGKRSPVGIHISCEQDGNTVKLGGEEEQHSEPKVPKTWLERVGLTPEDMQPNVPTREEYTLAGWRERTKDMRVVTDAACAKIERELDVAYDEDYGDDEHQKLLLEQRGWESAPKARVYSKAPEAVKKRTYRDRLRVDDSSAYESVERKKRERQKKVRDSKKPQKTESEELRTKLEKANLQKQKKAALNRKNYEKKVGFKTDNASTAAPDEQ